MFMCLLFVNMALKSHLWLFLRVCATWQRYAASEGISWQPLCHLDTVVSPAYLSVTWLPVDRWHDTDQLGDMTPGCHSHLVLPSGALSSLLYGDMLSHLNKLWSTSLTSTLTRSKLPEYISRNKEKIKHVVILYFKCKYVH